MSSVEDYSGLCGIIPTFATSDMQIRCHYELGHGGECSFEKHRTNFICYAGAFGPDLENYWAQQPNEDGIKRDFIDSVLKHKK